jgi:hypothetical protein
VADAEGILLRPKTLVSEDVGYFGLLLDTEGNRILKSTNTYSLTVKLGFAFGNFKYR